MAVKVTALDALFSKCVRERANWICEACERQTGTEQCAHVHGRRIIRLRHDPRNAFCLCGGCHLFFSDRPIDWTSFVTRKLGVDTAEWLVTMSRQVFKPPLPKKVWEKEARTHYRQELKRMEKMRQDGETGYIDFASYW